jgi:pimeloyl-ACP methyl ester carboxylesterase
MALKTQQKLIHYTDYTGIEPAIVFVHGYTCDETDWVNQVRHFGAVGQRVITLDLPGHGKSMDCIDNNLIMKGMGRNVVTLLHHLQVTRAIVVGHSMGTIIATEIAVQSPDVVIGIALIDGSRFARGDPEEAVAKTNAGFEQMGFTRCIENTFMSMFRPNSDKKEKKRIIDRACAQPEATSIKILSSAIRWCASDFEYQISV